MTACGLLQEETWQWLDSLKVNPSFNPQDFQRKLPTRNVNTVKRYLVTIQKRYSGIEPEDLISLASNYDDTFKQVNLLLTIRHSRILGEFITEVICTARYGYKPVITQLDITQFFEQKLSNESSFAALSPSSLIKIKANVMRIMVEGGLIADKKTLKILNTYPSVEVEQFAEKYQLTPYLKLLECKQ